jgi:molybdopterin synthase catalytic subunit
MTEKALSEIVDDARARFDIVDALVVHRVGELRPAIRSCWWQ